MKKVFCMRSSRPKRDVDMLRSPLIPSILQFTLPLVPEKNSRSALDKKME